MFEFSASKGYEPVSKDMLSLTCLKSGAGYQ